VPSTTHNKTAHKRLVRRRKRQRHKAKLTSHHKK